MLNPAFNINHMRDMTPIFYEVTHKVMSYLLALTIEGLLFLLSCELRLQAACRMARPRLT